MKSELEILLGAIEILDREVDEFKRRGSPSNHVFFRQLVAAASKVFAVRRPPQAVENELTVSITGKSYSEIEEEIFSKAAIMYGNSPGLIARAMKISRGRVYRYFEKMGLEPKPMHSMLANDYTPSPASLPTKARAPKPRDTKKSTPKTLAAAAPPKKRRVVGKKKTATRR